MLVREIVVVKWKEARIQAEVGETLAPLCSSAAAVQLSFVFCPTSRVLGLLQHKKVTSIDWYVVPPHSGLRHRRMVIGCYVAYDSIDWRLELTTMFELLVVTPSAAMMMGSTSLERADLYFAAVRLAGERKHLVEA